ncbi:MAG: 50S ribosomal protein L11 methyltransferase [Maricaulaceae bacterium]
MSEDDYGSWRVTARGAKSACEACAQALETLIDADTTAYGLFEEVEGGAWRLDVYTQTAADTAQVEALLRSAPELGVETERLADADWLALALSGLPPVYAGRFIVYGAHDAGRVPKNAVGLRIEAGQAFGTGHHGTTKGCLIAFHDLLKHWTPQAVLDLGAGTGALAMAAAKTTQAAVIATDIDPIAVRIIGENARLNGVEHAITPLRADGFRHPLLRGLSVDLVFANILANPLIGLARDVAIAVRPGGRAILSGLLFAHERKVRAAYLNRGFTLEHRHRLDGWATLVMRKI